jgi:serine/threonine-protein kinase RsbW
MPEPVIVRLTFPAKADYLLLARLALSGIGRALLLDDELLADLKLAVTEACGNAVRHAYGDGAGPIEIAFLVLEDRIEMIVEDQGAGIVPDGIPAAVPVDAHDAEPLLEGGMGLSIIRAIVDELDVQSGSDGNGTVVRMTKLLSAPAPAA